MCGIIGYLGKKEALPILIEGLHKESYRGYDSSGVVVFGNDSIHRSRAVGKLESLEHKLQGQDVFGTIGLGHNRWATHGNVTEENAHPHADCNENIFVVHNGIIENYQELKEKLQKEGHRFTSQTDTEVLAHLIEHFFKGNLENAVIAALEKVRGAYGIAVMAKGDPRKIVAARLSAPLVIAKNAAGGFVASDPAAILSHGNNMVFLDDREIAVIKEDSFLVMDLKHNIKEKTVTEITWGLEEAKKGAYPHFLLKEIMEQPESVANTLRGRLLIEQGDVKLGGLEEVADDLKKIEKIQILGCGSAANVGKVAEYLFEEYAGIPTKVDTGSEFRYKKPVYDKKTLYIFISQSGETADTIFPLQEIKKQGCLTLGIVNVVGSTIARQVDAGVYIHAGPEIAVVATKSFLCQLAAISMLAVFLGRQRGMSEADGKLIIEELLRLPNLISKTLLQANAIEAVAQKYKNSQHFFIIGRKYQFPIALEGAIKLKETAYVHAEGIAAGELKHGPIALVEPDFPTIALVPSDSVYDKMISNIQEVKARNGRVIAIATEGNEDIKRLADDVIYIPKSLEALSPILSTIPFQLLAYYLGTQRGHDVDKPRNLAKSVTVE
jgi:glucosamine--fructose-6-phosphate aminotransferase (isomerizing)